MEPSAVCKSHYQSSIGTNGSAFTGGSTGDAIALPPRSGIGDEIAI